MDPPVEKPTALDSKRCVEDGISRAGFPIVE
jgi:hypothetical protein